MGGRLEHEIRLLPQVISCSFSKDDYVVVLIEPSADPHTIQLAVERILHNAGSEATVRVIGPPEPAAAAASRTISPLVATATIASVAAIGVGSLVGGLAAVQHPRKPAPPHTQPSGSTAISPTDSIDVLRGIQVSGIAPLQRVSVPVEAPNHTLRALPFSRGPAVEAVSLTKAVPPIYHAKAKPASVEAARDHDGKTGHHGKHKGKGPKPWSHSVLLPSHDQRGKGANHG